MSEKKVDFDDNDEEEEDDDDYCPVNKTDSTDESEDDEIIDEPTETKTQTELNVTPYDQSKTDELWKSFSKKPIQSQTPKPSSTTTTPPPPTTTTKESQIPKPKPEVQTPKPTIESKPVNKVFDYAGEKVSVPVPTTNNTSLKRPASSSNSVLDRLGIGKKSKLSTLEKSRLDWSNHKQSESLTDDLDSHRRSKDSYVERKAFLERTEHREHDHYLTNVKKK